KRGLRASSPWRPAQASASPTDCGMLAPMSTHVPGSSLIPSLLALLLGATPAVAGPADEAAGAQPAAPANDASTIFPYPWQQKTLANALSVIVIPTPSEGLVSYRTVVRTGARDEYEKGATGFAHFFEHMMFRGTEKHPADEYNEIVTRIGADSNAYTSTDM